MREVHEQLKNQQTDLENLPEDCKHWESYLNSLTDWSGQSANNETWDEAIGNQYIQTLEE